jgi:hypothetical protein
MERLDRRTTTKRARAILLAVLTLLPALPSFAQTSLFGQTARPASDLARRVALISIPDRQLAVLENGTVIARFPVAVGAAASPSPTGEFRIASRVSHPAYYRPGTVIPAGKDNPLGTRWLGLSLKGYGIHGTNAPRSIGQAASHGCIRLRNYDMERLFALLRVGDAVQIRDERDDEIAETFGGELEEAAVIEPDQPSGR